MTTKRTGKSTGKSPKPRKKKSSSAKRAAKQSRQSPKASALIVGLTHVDPEAWNNWDGRSGCEGCDLDAEAMERLLKLEGYEVSVLLNAKATQSAVQTALQTAADTANPKDTFLFYYTGHGGQLDDQASELLGKDESDQKDETLCLYDGHLRDDDINVAFESFPSKSVIYMLADCCHSGTNFRALGGPKPRPIDFVRDLKYSEKMKAALLHISGCRDPEESAGFVRGGAFTLALTSVWDNGNYEGTWDTFHDAICDAIETGQNPQGNLYGPGAEKMATLRPFQHAADRASEPRGRARSRPTAADETSLSLVSIADSRAASRSVDAGSESRSVVGDTFGLPGTSHFNRQVQTRLSELGIYDASAIDGDFGPFSRWALGVFKNRAQTDDEDGVGPGTAQALLAADPDMFYRLRLDHSFASNVVRAMQRNGHWICRVPTCRNIVYVEGVDKNGRPNGNVPNHFNDRRLILRFTNGRPYFEENWDATTEPGHYWTFNPMNSRGAARIAFGQYYAWRIGQHRNNHEALRQVGKLAVYRDFNKDFKRAGDRLHVGSGFFINQHWGYDYPVDDLGKSSAGCLVGRTKSGHRQFMRLIKADPRYQVSRGYRFTTTILDGEKVSSDPGASKTRAGASRSIATARGSSIRDPHAGFGDHQHHVAALYIWNFHTPPKIKRAVGDPSVPGFSDRVLKLRMDQSLLWNLGNNAPISQIAGGAATTLLHIAINKEGLSLKPGSTAAKAKKDVTAVLAGGAKTVNQLGNALKKHLK